MRRSWRLSSRGPPWGAGRVLLGAVWVAGWAGLCAWVVWFAHTQAANPREEAMRGWCHLRVLYLYQRLLSFVSRVQQMAALLRVFNGYGPRSSTNLTYWGVAGCANNESLIRYKDKTVSMGLDYLTLGSLLMLVQDSERALVERITGMDIKSPLGLPSPRKPHYVINFLPGYAYLANLEAFIDFSAMVSPSLLSSILDGNSISLPPVFFSSDLRVGTVMVVPIFRHLVPENASREQRRESVSPTAWADFSYVGNDLQDVLHLLHNDSSASSYSIALYDTTDPQQPIQVLGPDPVKLESGSLFPYVLPGPVVPFPKHIEPFPEDLLGRKYEAHCRFEGPYPKWDLVIAPMLLGLLVLLVAVLLSLVIAMLAWKWRQMEEGLREMELCTAALERAEKSKSETVANTSHELRTPLTGMIGMIDELLESSLEEWQCEDLRVARACAGETVELINRVLDLAKLQAGRLQLETLPCMLRGIVHDTIAPVGSGAQSDDPQVTCRVDEGVPDVLMGDPTRLAQVIEELTAHAVSNAAGGRVAFHVCCVPPPPAHHVSASRFYLPCAVATAAVSPASPPPHASSRASHHLPSSSPAWHQLPACVRRFPPSTHLARLPQRLVARGSRGAGQVGGSSEPPHESPLTRLSHFLQRMGALGTGGSKEAGWVEGEEAQGGSGHGRLEDEVREWVDGACAAREEGEWMVVMACEDSGGGIPPEELRWVLDPYGDSHHAAAAHSSHATVAGSAGGDGNDKDDNDTKDTFFPHLFSRRGSRAAATATLTHDQRSAARPRWTPYPVRFLLSTALVAEMRGDMAVLSDAATGTTILLALPLRGEEDSGSFGDWGEDEESGGEADRVLPAVAAAATEEGGLPAVVAMAAGMAAEGKSVAVAGRAGCFETSQNTAAASAEEEEEEEKAVAVVGKAGLRIVRSLSLAAIAAGRGAAWLHLLPKPRSYTEGLGDMEGGQVRAVGVSGKAEGSQPGLHAHGEGAAGDAEGAALAGRGVAVVDDNAVNRMVARRTLQGYGAHVLLFPSGEDALQALSNATPSAPPIQLLLLDLHMPPGIDGFETARRIRAMESSQHARQQQIYQYGRDGEGGLDIQRQTMRKHQHSIKHEAAVDRQQLRDGKKAAQKTIVDFEKGDAEATRLAKLLATVDVTHVLQMVDNTRLTLRNRYLSDTDDFGDGSNELSSFLAKHASSEKRVVKVTGTDSTGAPTTHEYTLYEQKIKGQKSGGGLDDCITLAKGHVKELLKRLESRMKDLGSLEGAKLFTQRQRRFLQWLEALRNLFKRKPQDPDTLPGTSLISLVPDCGGYDVSVANAPLIS
ncbi:unnamed protein product [Closterium sp. Yama58-4]|nr:unnamed protein product [Closterium sp. Yama58-4]